MKRHEQARLLLHNALEDLALVDAVMDLENVTDEIVGFHCQQAAEKSLASHQAPTFRSNSPSAGVTGSKRLAEPKANPFHES